VDERALVEKLRQQLSPRYPRILAHQNLASIPGSRGSWSSSSATSRF